jgi:serine phosphatase RsbU (regulator of sigma subunit)
MADIDCGLIMRALLGYESECGDMGIIKQSKEGCFLALLDILGHGAGAREVALAARDYLDKNYRSDLVDIVNDLHNLLKGTRGTVGAFLRFHIETGQLSYAGIGNITVRILGQNPSHLVLRDGIIGYIMPKPEEKLVYLLPGDILLIHSDGIREHVEASACADLWVRSAQDIAEQWLQCFGKQNDDASVMVMKYIP